MNINKKEKISDYFYHIWKYSRIRDWYHKIKCRFFEKYYLLDTRLPKDSWFDTDHKMLYAMMALLLDYIEKEKPFEIINWESDDFHKHAKKEMLEIKDWWDNYENRQKEIEKALQKWSDLRTGGKEDLLSNINKPETEESQKQNDLLHELEDKLENEETEMMIRLIKIRKFLWT